MGRRDRAQRALKDFCHISRKPSSSKATSANSATVSKPRLKVSTDATDGAALTGGQSHGKPVKNLWSVALDRLSMEDRAAISGIGSDLKLDILQHLYKAAEKKRNDCEARGWKIEFNGQQIILREVAAKIIFWIDKFKQIGDMAVNFDPVHASLPWAGIRFFLEVRYDYTGIELLDKINV